MRRVDRRTNALQTDQPTDRQTDRASYRGALSHLKTHPKPLIFLPDLISFFMGANVTVPQQAGGPDFPLIYVSTSF